MKAKMRKLTLLAFYSDKAHITSMLQELGLLHLELQAPEWDESLADLKEEKAQWENVVALIEKYRDDDTRPNHASVSLEEVKESLLNYRKELESLLQDRHALEKQEALLAPWGTFDMDKIKYLESNNVMIRFYVASKREYKKYDFGSDVILNIHQNNGMVYFIAVSYGEEPDLPFEQVHMPDTSLSKIQADIAELDKKRQTVIENIRAIQMQLPSIQTLLQKYEDAIARIEANHSYAEKADGRITVITGWFPKHHESRIKEWLDHERLSYTIEAPAKGDIVPVLLRNKSYPKIFEHITKIFQLPHYNELDLTPFIAVFYPIFFAYCLGDAGYGIIIVAIALTGWFTFFKTMKNIAALGMVLGTMTMLVGIIKSGTIFGIPILEHTTIPLFQTLSRFVLITDDQDFVFNAFNVALMIGIVQIFVGVLTSIYKKVKFQGWQYGISGVGKLIIISSVLVLFLGKLQEMAVFSPYVPYASWVLYAGVALVLMYHDPDQSFGKRLGSGVLPLYFIFTNLLGDTLSYIRLFALGVASSILGLVVNQIGMQIMEGASIIGVAIAILFLVFGHSLNLALATLGAFVHPLRLTFVEFYNNAGFEGGGIAYHPFKKSAAKNLSN